MLLTINWEHIFVTWDNVRDGRYRCPLQTKSFFRNLSFTPSEIICILQNSIKLRPNVHSPTRLCYWHRYLFILDNNVTRCWNSIIAIFIVSVTDEMKISYKYFLIAQFNIFSTHLCTNYAKLQVLIYAGACLIRNRITAQACIWTK